MYMLTIKSNEPFFVRDNLNDLKGEAKQMKEIDIVPNNINAIYDFNKREYGKKVQGTVIILNQVKITFIDILEANDIKFTLRSLTLKRAIKSGLDTVEL